MKNKKDFIKLFDLNIPHLDHFDYYLDQLSKTDRFKDIKYHLELFEEADSSIDDFYAYKMSKSRDIIEFIKSTNTYTEMTLDKNLTSFPTNKSLQYEEGKIYLSVDLKSANWHSLKLYDQQNELGNSYEDFLKKFDLPKVFTHSKYLRQFIFGNVNPKKQQIIQRNIIQKDVIRKFDSEFEIEGVKNDEVVFILNDFKDSEKIIKNIDHERFKIRIFKIERVEDFRIFNYYDSEGNFIRKEMIGCSGNQFYMKIKEYITGEKINIKDLYFKSEGKLALWSHTELAVADGGHWVKF
jgi:hypothetical protein